MASARRGFGTRAMLVGLIAIVAVLASGPVARATKPQVAGLWVTPSTLPSSGGTFTVYARVRHGVSCTIFYYSGRVTKHTVNCSSGRVAYREHAPLNQRTTPATWSVWVEAHNGHQIGQSGQATIEVLSSVVAPPPVKGLDVCAPGPHCDYGYAYEAFQTWGNDAPNLLGDCTFAAAANWEQVVLNVRADPTVLGYEFAQAGGTAERGLAQASLWSYWQRYGIAGLRLTGLHRYYTDQTDAETAVRDYGAAIVEFQFTASDGFGEYTVPAGLHDAVVIGFTPEGPLVVTWGETLQMTWEQWGAEAIGMWGIAAS